jgi:ribonuclease T1
MPADQRRTGRLAVVLVLVALVLLVWWWVGQGPGGSFDGTAQERASATSSVSAAAPTPRDTSGLPRVPVAELPVQARQTLDLIAVGGPYPYPRDGVVFQNRERLLPRKAGGYYREYTVPTPGEDDRGARRIIVGKGGEVYWTADHYASFSVIVLDVGNEGGGS